MGSPSPSRLDWLTPPRCRVLFALLLAAMCTARIAYLHFNCPLDLSGDEAQYWDWSRQLEWSYYSKGPLVAWIIRSSTELFGTSMPAIRYPAVLFSAMTAVLGYWLTVKLFQSDRLALGGALLSAGIPIFMAGSLLMTIDPPFVFCWAAATCLAVKALFDESKWAWVALGAALGVGFLAKYGMFLWLAGLVVFLCVDRPSRRWLRTPWPYACLAVAAVFAVPVIVWNMRHGWVSALHVAHQTGGSARSLVNWLGPLEMLAVQAGAIGPAVFAMVIGAAAHGMRRPSRSTTYLLAIGGTFLAICFVGGFRAKIQPNWPAPAYFTLVIAAAYFLSGQLHRRFWQAMLGLAVVTEIAAIVLAHFSHAFYPAIPESVRVRDIDPTFRLRGWDEMGRRIEAELAKLPPGSFIVADNYQTTALAAFYTPGRPRTYYAGSFFTTLPGRLTQYDYWPDRSLDRSNTELIGRDAVYVGVGLPEFYAAFDSTELLEPLVIHRNGREVQIIHFWIARGFKGFERRGEEKY